MTTAASLQERWPTLAAVPPALAWLSMRADLGLAYRTIDAYARGVSEYLTFSAAAAVDPMQWWGALTNQFAELATSAMKDSAADATKALAGNLMKQSFDAAAETIKKVAAAPGRAVAGAAKSPAPKAGAETAARKAAKRPASARRRRTAPVAT